MKNPIPYLKHLVKDPITTVAEADARKKEILPWLYGSIALAVVPSVLSGLIEALGFLMIFGMIGIFATMFFGFLIFVTVKPKQKFVALTCEDCDTMFTLENKEDFDKFISYAVVSEKVKVKVTPASCEPGKAATIIGRITSDVSVEITLKCPKCGKLRTLVYSITPFKAEKEEKNVPYITFASTKLAIETAVNSVADSYKADPNSLPFSIHSIHNENYANRTKPQNGNNTTSYPVVSGVKISYHRTPDELVRGFFVDNELNGSISVKK